MKKLVLLTVLLVGLSYSAHLFFKFDLGKMPDVPDGGFVLLVGGVKGIMSGVDDVRPERKYLASKPSDFPEWYEDVWSYCYMPTDTEPMRDYDWGTGARLEAVCQIEADNERILVGYIISVPDL